MTDLVIHVARWQGVRMVGEALRVKRYDREQPDWVTETAWPPQREDSTAA